MLAASRLSNFSQSSWHAGSVQKPTFDCTSPEDGNFSVNVYCDPAVFQDGDEFCQVIVFYTRSWQPIGDAIIYVNDAIDPSVQLIGFAQEWRAAGYQWTIQQMTSPYEASLQNRSRSFDVEYTMYRYYTSSGRPGECIPAHTFSIARFSCCISVEYTHHALYIARARIIATFLSTHERVSLLCTIISFCFL